MKLWTTHSSQTHYLPFPLLHSPWAQLRGPLASTQLSPPFSPILPNTLGTKLKPTIEPLHYTCRYVSPLGRASRGNALHNFLRKTMQGPWHFKPALLHPAAYPTHPEKERQYLRFVMFHPSHSTVSECYWAGLLAGCLSCPASITFPTSLAVGDLFCFHVNNVRKAASWQWDSGVCFTCFLRYKLILSGERKQLYLSVCFFCLLVCPDKRWPDPTGWVGRVGSLSVESKPKFLRFCFLWLPMHLKCFPMRPWATTGS